MGMRHYLILDEEEQYSKSTPRFSAFTPRIHVRSQSPYQSNEELDRSDFLKSLVQYLLVQIKYLRGWIFFHRLWLPFVGQSDWAFLLP